MSEHDLQRIADYLWGIADDVLCDVCERSNHRRIVLPMTVLRRLDEVLEDSKRAMPDVYTRLDRDSLIGQDAALRRVTRPQFGSTSRITLHDLRDYTSRQQLKADFEAYLDGFSPDIQEILDNFEFREQVSRLSSSNALGRLIEKYTSPEVSLSPRPVVDPGGTVRHPGIDDYGMATIFEDLVQRFNDERDEEVGEHWTPRQVARLIAKLMILPVADRIESGTYRIYDGACGTGGMLAEGAEVLRQIAKERGKEVSVLLFGQDISVEVSAICKATLLLRGEGETLKNIVTGPQHSTITNDAFPGREFDFMLSSPPCRKSCKGNLIQMGDNRGIRDPRFLIEHASDPQYSLVARHNDGQMLFLANLLSKMKENTLLGSRVLQIHDMDSLVTGDAGQGESNLRRWIIENDWLEAIVALPVNVICNYDTASYVWVLTNRKPEHRKGKVQLIDGTDSSDRRRKNSGDTSCEFGDSDIRLICDTFLKFEESDRSKIVENAAFGYWPVIVDRPLRIEGADPYRAYGPAEIKALQEGGTTSEASPPVIRAIHADGTAANRLRGLFEIRVDGEPAVVEYEPDLGLRDIERVPLMEDGGIDSFLRREVLPHAPDAWYESTSVQIGYEISFTRYFYDRNEHSVADYIPGRVYLATIKPRVYTDTSVIGGCEDDEFREPSRHLIDQFARGKMTLVLSPIAATELLQAPGPVRDIINAVPSEHVEKLEESREAEILATRYIERGALGPRMIADALHIAAATVAGVDVLVSWNFRHIVNSRRIRAYNEINREMGYGPLDIKTPRSVSDDGWRTTQGVRLRQDDARDPGSH